MLFGSPLRSEISRNGRASPDVRKADSNRDECTTDLTRYRSRVDPVAFEPILVLEPRPPCAVPHASGDGSPQQLCASISHCAIKRRARRAGPAPLSKEETL